MPWGVHCIRRTRVLHPSRDVQRLLVAKVYLDKGKRTKLYYGRRSVSAHSRRPYQANTFIRFDLHRYSIQPGLTRFNRDAMSYSMEKELLLWTTYSNYAVLCMEERRYRLLNHGHLLSSLTLVICFLIQKLKPTII